MLTIADVTCKKFSATRMREGYEIAEVDDFVAEVEETLTRQQEEIATLREQLAAAEQRAETGPDGHGATDPDAAFKPAAGHATQAVLHDQEVRTSSVSAVRLLEIATVNAEQLVSEAKHEAVSLVATARAAADQLAATSRDEAERIATELAEQKQEQEHELQLHRSTVLGELAGKRAELQAQIETLDELEQENRSRLHDYFTEQIARLQPGSASAGAELNGVGPDPADAVAS